MCIKPWRLSLLHSETFISIKSANSKASRSKSLTRRPSPYTLGHEPWALGPEPLGIFKTTIIWSIFHLLYFGTLFRYNGLSSYSGVLWCTQVSTSCVSFDRCIIFSPQFKPQSPPYWHEIWETNLSFIQLPPFLWTLSLRSSFIQLPFFSSLSPCVGGNITVTLFSL